MWLEQFSELLEKLAVAREVAGRIFPLHLVEQSTRTLQRLSGAALGPHYRAEGAGRSTTLYGSLECLLAALVLCYFFASKRQG